MALRFKYFSSKNNPCPVCRADRLDCRQALDSGLVFCRGNSVNTTYIHRGYDKNGFGIYGNFKVKANANALIQMPAAAEKIRIQRESLPVADRDVEYRKLLSELTLCPAHYIALKERGLSKQEMEAGMFRSVRRSQPLITRLKPLLPGVSTDGMSLSNSHDGMLIPLFMPDGKIPAYQIRLNGENPSGRYRWATSANLSNLELPLTCCYPIAGLRKKEIVIGLCEGILKPFIAAQKRGQIFIGASGGSFASSPECLKHYLKQFDSTSVLFYPDAGAMKNYAVMAQYRSVWKLLAEWGYVVKVAWWGQDDKSSPDVDELDRFTRPEEKNISDFS